MNSLTRNSSPAGCCRPKGICTLSLVLSLAVASFGVPPANDNPKPNPTRSTTPVNGAEQFLPAAQLQMLSMPFPFLLDDPIPDSIFMNFEIEWTTCQLHRVSDSSPLILTLDGIISSNASLIWNLTALAPQVGGLPELYFIENIFTQTNAGENIPLTWEIALDGGSFTALTLQPDNTLTTIFPLGDHDFQLRITGTPPPHAADGFYRLQLAQCLIPQM